MIGYVDISEEKISTIVSIDVMICMSAIANDIIVSFWNEDSKKKR